MSLHVFGIRHHGPGCARALRSALEQLEPDVLLIEGPPDANDSLTLLAQGGLKPPVALLVHAVEAPERAAIYPFATFSPEWQALCYGTERGLPLRFMDLPCAHTLAVPEPELSELEAEAAEETSSEGCLDQDTGCEAAAELSGLRDDPLGLLAEAAGYPDHEQWWDVQVEQRRAAAGLFDAILEAMTALRSGRPEPSLEERQREAHMRTVIRAAQREGFQRIAVICGAYHAPALATLRPAKEDAELLKGLPKTKVASAFIPWTYDRLSSRSGYGAGVESPGWYAHLFEHGAEAPTVWATLAARLLRAEDLDASSASVIETVRLASALASLRELPMPGLGELRDAIEAVLTPSAPARLDLIRRRLEIGEVLGEVPEHAGKLPLMRDFERELKRLRLKLSPEQSVLELDLRKDLDRERSQLFHRLQTLSVDFARPFQAGRGAGTFRESWQLCWTPELSLSLLEKSVYGNTLESAATALVRERAARADLPALTSAFRQALLAALPGALPGLLAQLERASATRPTSSHSSPPSSRSRKSCAMGMCAILR